MLTLINQLFEIDKKCKENSLDVLRRNIDRMYHEFEQKGYKIVNPIGARYDERDTSIEANIIDTKNGNNITKVLKPTVYFSENGQTQLIQKAIVIVE